MSTTRRRPARGLPVMAILIGGIVVLGIVAIVAVALTGNDKKSDGGVAQTRPVTVEGTALPQFESTANDPAIGQTVPTLVGENFAGRRVTIGDDGRPKAIVFVAHWCPHCQREVPRIARFLRDPGLPRGVELFFVPTGTNASYPNYPPSTWLRKDGVGSVPTLVDDSSGTAFDAYGGSSYPYFVLVGKNDKVIARFSGEIEESKLPQVFAAAATGRLPGVGGSGGSSPSS